MTHIRPHLAVGLGAALGALLRFAVGAALPALAATGLVNVVGSLVIGFVATLTAPNGRRPLGPLPRQFMMSGLCGGFTTFSALSLDTFLLFADHRPAAAALYLAAVIAVSLAAAWTGQSLAGRRTL